MARFRATEPERTDIIRSTVDGRDIQVVALDGPFRSKLDIIGTYRRAERILTPGFARRIGKPGQSSATVGRLLNEATNRCAEIVLSTARLRAARHTGACHATALVEAFPSAFLGVMLTEPERLAPTRRNRSDLYFRHLGQRRMLDRLVQHLLPGHSLEREANIITNHDERAALVCALTALCVSTGSYTMVGDEDGRIVLPPMQFIQSWAIEVLQRNTAGGDWLKHDRTKSQHGFGASAPKQSK